MEEAERKEAEHLAAVDAATAEAAVSAAAAGAPAPDVPPIAVGDDISTYFHRLTSEQIKAKRDLHLWDRFTLFPSHVRFWDFCTGTLETRL